MGQLEILELLRDRPFKPFRIRLSDDTYYDIRHPEMVIPTPATIFIGVPDPNSAKEAPAGVEIVSLMHVVKIEFLSPPTPSKSSSDGI